MEMAFEAHSPGKCGLWFFGLYFLVCFVFKSNADLADVAQWIEHRLAH